MRRLVVVEALDAGFVVRASGDAGKISRTFSKVDSVVSFLRWYMIQPPDAEAGKVTFPLLALRESEEVTTALEPKPAKPEEESDILPTESFAPEQRPEPRPQIVPTESIPIPAGLETTRRILTQRWRRPT